MAERTNPEARQGAAHPNHSELVAQLQRMRRMILALALWCGCISLYAYRLMYESQRMICHSGSSDRTVLQCRDAARWGSTGDSTFDLFLFLVTPGIVLALWLLFEASRSSTPAGDPRGRG